MAKRRTKAVRYLLRKIGYDLRRLQKTKIHPGDGEQPPLGRAGFAAFDAAVLRPVTSFTILFRSCARVDVFGQDRGRIVDVPKSELVLRCLNALLGSIRHAREHGIDAEITLCVLDDHSDRDTVARMEALLAGAPCRAGLEALDVTGNGPSVGAALNHARAAARDVIYLVEDDYLHDRPAILEMVRSYERIAGVLDRDVVLFPSDYPDFYRHIRPAHVVLGSHRHWRRIDSTTGTFVTSRAILAEHWESYIGLARYGEDPAVTEANTINPIYRQVPCFSPLPSLAVHLQHDDTLSPYVDWREWWEAARL